MINVLREIYQPIRKLELLTLSRNEIVIYDKWSKHIRVLSKFIFKAANI